MCTTQLAASLSKDKVFGIPNILDNSCAGSGIPWTAYQNNWRSCSPPLEISHLRPSRSRTQPTKIANFTLPHTSAAIPLGSDETNVSTIDENP